MIWRFGMQKLRILAIGSHPDDIELGCGGMLIKAARAGHDVYMYVMTRGGKSGSATQRTNELFDSAKFIGAKTLWVDNFKDTDLAVESKVINHIEYFIHRSDPDVILTHPLNDYHHDHRAVAECTMEAARNSQNVLAYEIPATRDFIPQLFYDVSDAIDDKVRLIGLFLSQRGKSVVRAGAVRGMAEYRASQSRMNSAVTHVEAFQVQKLCTNVDFGLIKYNRVEMPEAVSDDIIKSLKEIIRYSPYAGRPQLLDTVEPSINPADRVASQMLIRDDKMYGVKFSSTGIESTVKSAADAKGQTAKNNKKRVESW
jgi:LmbE family N-acetylglucosaminyl deacetylase